MFNNATDEVSFPVTVLFDVSTEDVGASAVAEDLAVLEETNEVSIGSILVASSSFPNVLESNTSVVSIETVSVDTSNNTVTGNETS